jgi:hypothetical protein
LNGKDRGRQAIAELEAVRVIRDVDTDGCRIRKNTFGTVVAVYGDGAAYAVELQKLPGSPEVVTLRADQITRVP